MIKQIIYCMALASITSTDRMYIFAIQRAQILYSENNPIE
jgi:hypothetical protein